MTERNDNKQKKTNSTVTFLLNYVQVVSRLGKIYGLAHGQTKDERQSLLYPGES